MELMTTKYEYHCTLCGDRVEHTNAYISGSVYCMECHVDQIKEKMPPKLATEMLERVDNYWRCEWCREELKGFDYRRFCNRVCKRNATNFKARKRNLANSLHVYKNKYGLKPTDLMF